MENKEKDVLYYEKMRTKLLAAILAVLVLLMAAVGIGLGTVVRYGSQIGDIITRLETVSRELEELDLEKMVATANEVTDAIEAAKLAEIMDSLNDVSSQLRDVDWKGISGNLSEVVSHAQESLEDAQDALEQINSIDISALNQAIRDLQDVIEPLANMTKIFG